MGKLCRGKISHKRVTVGTVLYYCNAVFVGSLRHITDKLQCIPNAAAHLVTGTCKFDHGLSHLLHEELHWLDIPERIHYKLRVTVHCCLQHKAPEYLVDCYTPDSDIPSRRHLWSASRSPDGTTLPAQHFRSSGLFCRWSDSLELATGQSPRRGAQQQQLKTIAKNEPISLLPLCTHSTVKMLHDSALYKSIIDIDCECLPYMQTILAIMHDASLLSAGAGCHLLIDMEHHAISFYDVHTMWLFDQNDCYVILSVTC